MKVCTKCKVEKELTEFCRNKIKKDRLESWCRVCKNAYNKKWKAENRDSVSEYNKKWNVENKEKKAELRKVNYQKNREAQIEGAKKWNAENKERRAENHKRWKAENKDGIREYYKKRRQEDPLYKLSCNVRRSIRRVLDKKGYGKDSRTLEILGCTYEDFFKHLNDNPYGLVYGDEGLDVDHIIPISSATSEEEVLRLNHYTNFQLLPSEYNRHIKSDNEWDEDHFRVWLSKKTKNIKNCYIK